jgi:hypothetical protein
VLQGVWQWRAGGLAVGGAVPLGKQRREDEFQLPGVRKKYMLLY